MDNATVPPEPSIQRQLIEAQKNLRLIQERKEEYVLNTDIPLQLIKQERDLLDRIVDLKQQLAALSGIPGGSGPYSDNVGDTPKQLNTMVEWLRLESEGDQLLSTSYSGDLELAERREKAFDLYLLAQASAERTKAESVVIARLCRKITACHRWADRWEQARTWCLRGLNAIESTSPVTSMIKIEHARLYLEQAYCSMYEERPLNEIQQMAQKVIDILDKELLIEHSDAQTDIGNAYNLLAIIAADSDQEQDFLRLYRLAIEAYKSAQDEGGLSDLEFNFQFYFLKLGDYQKTIDYYEKHDPATTYKAKPDRVPIAYLNLAVAYLDAGLPNEALDSTQKCLAESSRSGDFITRLRAYVAWAEALKDLAASTYGSDRDKNAWDSIAKTSEGEGIAREYGQNQLESKLYRYQAHRVRAECNLIIGKIDLADTELRAAALLESEIVSHLDSSDVMGEVQRVYAMLAITKNQPLEALDYLNESNAKFKKAKSNGKMVRVNIERAKLQIKLRQVDSARQTLYSARMEAQASRRDRDLNEIERLQQQVESQEPVDFAIITALEIEATAIVARLENHIIKQFEKESIRTYHYGTIQGSNQRYRVVVAILPSIGNVPAANATTDTLTQWNPRFVLMVGIAGGIPQDDLDLGDVVIADQVVGYDYGKVTADGLRPRDHVYPTSAFLRERIHNFWDKAWTQQVNITRPTNAARTTPKKFVGPIASGNKIVASTEFRNQLLAHWPKLLAVETEAEGVFAAVFDRPQIRGALVIRGICDMADERKSDEWQEYAANVAAAFTVNFLKSGLIESS